MKILRRRCGLTIISFNETLLSLESQWEGGNYVMMLVEVEVSGRFTRFVDSDDEVEAEEIARREIAFDNLEVYIDSYEVQAGVSRSDNPMAE